MHRVKTETSGARAVAGRGLRAAACAALAFAGLLTSAATAEAAGGGGYAQWNVTGGAGTVTVPVAGFPVARLTTTSSSTLVSSGANVFLNAGTPFGAAFGSSQNLPYLLLRTAPGNSPSTTTLTFDTPPAAGGWGFNLGDIDADLVRVSATAPDGSAVPVAGLGFQGAYNFCQGSPLPRGCAGRQTDAPVWDPASGTLTGNVADTDGASGWFQPGTAIKTLTLRYTAQSGLPVYQLWLAARSYAISGRIIDTGSCPVAHRDPLVLLKPDGSPVTLPNGQIVTTSAAADGSYVFPSVAPGAYQVAVSVPAGHEPQGPTTRSADTTAGDVAGVDFTLRCAAIAEPDVVAVPEDGKIRIPLPSGIDPAQPVTIIEPPRHGTVDVVDGELVYVPYVGYTGLDTFVIAGTGFDGKVVMRAISLRVAASLPATGPVGLDGLVGSGGGLLAGGVALTVLTRRRRGGA